jgi:hypothetical protein
VERSPDDEIETRVRADVERHGWHVALVPPEGSTPGWALSIGLAERFAHPEVVVFGPEVALLHRLVNALGERVRTGARFEAGTEHEGVLAGHRLAFRAVERKWIPPFLGNAAWHYRSEDFPAVQCFWPDPRGRFPWEPGSDPDWRGQQPQLFERETHRALSEALTGVLLREGAI